MNSPAVGGVGEKVWWDTYKASRGLTRVDWVGTDSKQRKPGGVVGVGGGVTHIVSYGLTVGGGMGFELGCKLYTHWGW